MERRRVLLVLALFWAFTTQAQRVGFRNYSIQNGLSQSVVTSVLQDESGYVWIGTEYGLNRFNGRSFRTFGTADGLRDIDIRVIAQLADGRLAIGTETGVDQIDDGRITPLKEASVVPRGPVTAILQDQRGSIWIGTEEWGAFQFNNDTFVQHSRASGLAGNSVRAIREGPGGTIWIATDSGLSAITPEGIRNRTVEDGLPDNRLFDVRVRADESVWVATYNGLAVIRNGEVRIRNTDSGLVGNRIRALVEDRFGHMWIGTESGLTWTDGTLYQTITDDNGLANNMVISLATDVEGNVWVGSYGGGVDLLPGFMYLQYTVNDGLLSNMITSFAQTSDGTVWISTYGGGIGRIDGRRVMPFSSAQGLHEPRVYTLMTDREDRIWIGTRNGLSQIRNGRITRNGLPEPLIHPQVRTVLEDRSGDIWIGTYGGGLGRYRGRNLVRHVTRQDGLSGDIVMKVIEDRSGRIWAATYGGVTIIEGDSVRSITTEDGLVQNTVLTVFEDSRGWIWIGTFAGITVIRDGVMSHHTEENGLPNPVAYAISEDAYGFIWVGSNRGLIRIDPFIEADVSDPRRIKDQLRYKWYTSDTGLLAEEMNANATHRASDGSLWFGSVGGAVHYRPWLDQPVDRGPAVHIEQIRVFDGERPVRDGIRFRHDQNFIGFDFSGLSYRFPNGITYEYRIRGVDQVWSRTTQPTVRYTTLPDGEYQFEVRARNPDGYWSVTRDILRFRISPPFWKTWWFLLLGLAGVAASAGFIYNYVRISKMVDVERIRTRIASDLHDDVGASLTEIALRADFVGALNEPDRVRESVRQIGEMSRQIVTTMDDIVWSIDARNDTLGDLLDRMQDYAITVLGHKGIEPHFEFIGVDSERTLALDVRQNLYLILKEAVNNAAKHSQARNMRIRFIRSERGYELTLADDGRGFPDTARAGSHGLRNMRMRADRIGATLTFDSTPNGLNIHVNGTTL